MKSLYSFNCLRFCLSLSLILLLIEALPNGAPERACKTMIPEHPQTKAKNEKCPYKIKLEKAGKNEVILKLTGPKPFKGFMIKSKTPGSIKIMSKKKAKYVNCSKNGNNTITHTNPDSDRTSLSFKFLPDEASVKKLEFEFTVAQDFDSYWAAQKADVDLERRTKREVEADSMTDIGDDIQNNMPCVGVPPCRGYGDCINGQCHCFKGYSPPSCLEDEMGMEMENYTTSNNQEFHPEDDSMPCVGVPPCQGHGQCVKGNCRCDEGYLPPYCKEHDSRPKKTASEVDIFPPLDNLFRNAEEKDSGAHSSGFTSPIGIIVGICFLWFQNFDMC